MERFLLEAPAIIVVHSGPGLVFEFINPRYQSVFPGRKLLGKPLLEGLPELAGTPIQAMVEHVYKTGETVYGNEVLIPLAPYEGAPLENNYYNFIYQARRDAQGQIDGIMVFAFEVTGQVEARRKLERGEESLRRALEAGRMGVWHLDLRSNTSTRSLTHDQLFGYDHLLPEWGYQQFMEHVLPEDQAYVAGQFEQAAQTGELTFEARIRRKDGCLRWIAGKGQTYFEGEKPVRMAGVLMDITERKHSEEKLQALSEQLAASNQELRAANQTLAQVNEQLTRTNQELDQYVYKVSHDIRSPVASIRGLLGLIQLETVSPQVNAYLTLIENRVNKLDEFIQSVLAHSRSVNTELAPTPIDFNQLLDQCLEELQHYPDRDCLRVERQLPAPDVFWGDGLRLQILLKNLLSNAIKYRNREATSFLAVRVGVTCTQAVLVLEDNGVGIPAQYVEKVFGMFFRATDQSDGSGLFILSSKPSRRWAAQLPSLAN